MPAGTAAGHGTHRDIELAAGANEKAPMLAGDAGDEPEPLSLDALYVLAGGFGRCQQLVLLVALWAWIVHGAQVMSMVFYALYGLSISIVLKRFGAMTRTFINAAAIVLNAALDVTFFGDSISVLEATCFAVILASIFLYSNLAKDYKPPAALPSAT